MKKWASSSPITKWTSSIVQCLLKNMIDWQMLKRP
jgi:hypothetical protein